MKSTSRIAIVGKMHSGKALALDTKIPTPDGWTTMGELSVGDKVFSASGAVCSVTYVTEVYTPEKQYKILFDDMTEVTACSEHQWFVETKRERYNTLVGVVLKTAEMVGNTRTGSNWNYTVGVTAPLELEAAHLPIPPYTLGAWLGDGTSASGQLTSVDLEVISRIEKDGFTVAGPRQEMTWTIKGLQPILREEGLLKNKHIPSQYLRSSYSQRLELLQGLMDTDGSIGNLTCEITQKRKELAYQIYELVCSLGFRPIIRAKKATCNDKDCGLVYRVSFRAQVNPFLLSRKRSKWRKPENKESTRRAIVAIEPVETLVPMRCIQVDDPSSLYLITDAMIPTHNTTLAEALVALGYTRLAFADPVKDVSGKMLTVFESELTGRGDYYGRDDINKMKGHPAIRKLLQLVGTELGREWLGPDTIWIDKFEELVRAYDSHSENTGSIVPIVNDDCRFPNESERLNELGFTVIKLIRDDDERYVSIYNALVKTHPSWTPAMIHESIQDIQSHPSETNVDLITADIDIASTSVEQLQTLAADIAMGVDICQNLSSS